MTRFPTTYFLWQVETKLAESEDGTTAGSREIKFDDINPCSFSIHVSSHER